MTKLDNNQMTSHQPLVSICIPTYNAENSVINTLQSVLNQTYQNLEVLVVDNASTDNTLNLVRQTNDPRLVVHRNESNIGGEQNWSKCIQLANGEYIAVFHADDRYLPNMVEKQVKVLQNNPAVGAVFTLASRINDRGEMIGHDIELPSELKNKRVYHLPEIFGSILRHGNFLMCPSCMVRGKLYKKLVPFDWDRFETSADLDMWLRILEKRPIAILDEKLMRYRVSNKQPAYQASYLRTEQADFFKVIDCHLSVKSSILHIPRGYTNKYELIRSTDILKRATNYLIKRQPRAAKKLLRDIFSFSLLFCHWLRDTLLSGRTTSFGGGVRSRAGDGHRLYGHQFPVEDKRTYRIRCLVYYGAGFSLWSRGVNCGGVVAAYRLVTD